MKQVLKSFAAIALLSTLALNAAPASADSETLGTLGGAAAGGLIGSQFGKGGGNVAATVGGVIAGGIIGNAIGRDADGEYYHEAPAPRPVYAAPPPRPVYVEPAPVYYAPAPTVVYEDPRPWRHYRWYHHRGY
ncbi:MAG TPA: glycine zipper 2TM domain-containing protein [Alphaproteobacteria bacterium]|nr:glycine zipper 2TM domain-containing protein [Alphaproteobacteria bacterium]